MSGCRVVQKDLQGILEQGMGFGGSVRGLESQGLLGSRRG